MKMADKDQNITVLTDIEHCLKRSQLYVGSTSLQKQEFWVPEGDKVIKKEIEYCPALFKIFSEIIDNSSDEINVRGYGDTINMEYNYDEGEFKISDNGRGIPLEKHKETGKYFPELVFAQLRAGSNFDDSIRKTSGMNGVGATLTSIFSEFLYAKIKRDGKIYEQSFKKNLSSISTPKIEKNDKQKGTGTAIYFKPDYNIFKEKLPIELVKKRCLELSVMYSKVTINLRIIEKGKNEDIVYKNKKFEDFIKLFDTTYSIYEDSKTNTKLAICNNKISENFEHFSNINGIDTFRGGNHVDSVKEIFCEAFKEKIYKEHPEVQQTIEQNAIDSEIREMTATIMQKQITEDKQKKETKKITIALSPEIIKKIEEGYFNYSKLINSVLRKYFNENKK
jgi:DNA gyrase/topoisomerase IV subunit B